MVCLIYFHFYMLVNVLLYRSSLKTVENLEVVKALPADRLLLETGQTGDVCLCLCMASSAYFPIFPITMVTVLLTIVM